MTQKKMIMRALNNYGTITAHQASREFGIDRLAARIWDLRDDGFDIHKEMIRVRGRSGEVCHVARYSL